MLTILSNIITSRNIVVINNNNKQLSTVSIPTLICHVLSRHTASLTDKSFAGFVTRLGYHTSSFQSETTKVFPYIGLCGCHRLYLYKDFN